MNKAVSSSSSRSSDIRIYIILFLAVLAVIFLTTFVYFSRRRVLCYYPTQPWCWTDWTCPNEPIGSAQRCPVLPTQKLAESCLPANPNAEPGCKNAWAGI